MSARNNRILHIDGDSFFASCEIALDPKLEGRPVWVGGGRRGDGIVIAADRQCALLLQSLMDGKSPTETAVVVQPKNLVARDSTDKLAAVHPSVKRFVDFIRRHFHEDLNHEDFCIASGMSSTALFNACKKILAEAPAKYQISESPSASKARK